MIDRTQALSASRQARALGISRGSVYYLPRPTSAADLAVMRRIDALHMARTLEVWPVCGKPDAA
jgi:putative transposase